MENSSQVCFRHLSSYKYQLTNEFHRQLDIRPPVGISTPWLKLGTQGGLVISKGYCWDGPSGPTLDTPSFMRASLVHDAIYQLIRTGFLPQEHQKYADILIGIMCKEDGMAWFRRKYVVWALRRFGAMALKPKKGGEAQEQSICWPPND
jgi:hypothetical protein